MGHLISAIVEARGVTHGSRAGWRRGQHGTVDDADEEKIMMVTHSDSSTADGYPDDEPGYPQDDAGHAQGDSGHDAPGYDDAEYDDSGQGPTDAGYAYPEADSEYSEEYADSGYPDDDGADSFDAHDRGGAHEAFDGYAGGAAVMPPIPPPTRSRGKLLAAWVVGGALVGIVGRAVLFTGPGPDARAENTSVSVRITAAPAPEPSTTPSSPSLSPSPSPSAPTPSTSSGPDLASSPAVSGATTRGTAAHGRGAATPRPHTMLDSDPVSTTIGDVTPALVARGLVNWAGTTAFDAGVASPGSTHRATLTIANPSDGPASVLGVKVTGPHASDFALTSAGTCSGAGRVLTAGTGTCTVVVDFHPASWGAKVATLEVTVSGTTRLLRVPLRGAAPSGTGALRTAGGNECLGTQATGSTTLRHGDCAGGSDTFRLSPAGASWNVVSQRTSNCLAAGGTGVRLAGCGGAGQGFLPQSGATGGGWLLRSSDTGLCLTTAPLSSVGLAACNASDAAQSFVLR